MILTKQDLVVFIAGVVLGVLAGFFSGKAIYDRPLDESVETDTVVVFRTLPDYNPTAKDSAQIKLVTRWLPKAVHDTIFAGNYAQKTVEIMHDTVCVEVPITSKHYGSETYDAWVSGFEPSLDSIFVYQKTEYITKTVTLSKPPNKWELDVVGGVDYGITSKQWLPFAGGELTLNNHKRLKMGIEGGVKRNETTKTFEPYAAAKLKLMVF